MTEKKRVTSMQSVISSKLYRPLSWLIVIELHDGEK